MDMIGPDPEQNTAWFFGYGSLVNCQTHDYPDAHPAKLNCWRRAWVQTDAREFCFLSAHHVLEGAIDGLIARVPVGDWAALDARELGYTRHPVRPLIVSERETSDIQVYSVPPETHEKDVTPKAILLSYLDVVFTGYREVFGEDGVHRFVETTDGWERPVLDDRAAPIYPRHLHLDDRDLSFIDRTLSELPCEIRGLDQHSM